LISGGKEQRFAAANISRDTGSLRLRDGLGYTRKEFSHLNEPPGFGELREWLSGIRISAWSSRSRRPWSVPPPRSPPRAEESPTASGRGRSGSRNWLAEPWKIRGEDDWAIIVAYNEWLRQKPADRRTDAGRSVGATDMPFRWCLLLSLRA